MLLQQEWILIALWILFGIIHSVLASSKVKQWAFQTFALNNQSFRLIYNSIAVLTLLPIIFFLLNVDGRPVLPESTVFKFLGLMLATWSIIVFRLAFKQYNIAGFLGLKPEAEGALLKDGVLGKIRHPLYTGAILMLFGYFLFSPNSLHLINAICLSAYILVGIQFEERRLIEKFGDAYLAYKKEVPMLFPRI